MRVVQAMAFGGPEVLVPSEAPDPVAGPGQVVVDVSVAEVQFVDMPRGPGSGQANGCWSRRRPAVSGSLLVQLAHAAGARVIGAARGKRKLDLAQELGADP